MPTLLIFGVVLQRTPLSLQRAWHTWVEALGAAAHNRKARTTALSTDFHGGEKMNKMNFTHQNKIALIRETGLEGISAPAATDRYLEGTQTHPQDKRSRSLRFCVLQKTRLEGAVPVLQQTRSSTTNLLHSWTKNPLPHPVPPTHSLPSITTPKCFLCSSAIDSPTRTQPAVSMNRNAVVTRGQKPPESKDK